MKKENKYLLNLTKGFENDDLKLIEDTMWDFYYYFYEAIDTEDEEKYYSYQYEIIKYFYNKIKREELKNYNLNLQYDLINPDLRNYIVQPYWEKLIKGINTNVLREKSKNDTGETNGENLLTELNNLAEYIFFRYDFEDRFEKQFITKDLIEFIEDQLVVFSNLILMGREVNENMNIAIEDYKMLKKFRGNSLIKRKNDNINKYSKVAKILKVAADNYPQIKITQKTACEMTRCNEFSFARWKNYKDNFDLFLKWQGELNEQDIETTKNEIKRHLKLHTDM